MSATESSEESITLEWVFDQGDVRLAQVYLAPKKEDEERIKLYNFTGYGTFTSYYRYNLQSERYENAGQIEWASARNIKLTFGVRTVHVDTMTRKNKPQSRSRRFKASDGMEYKWRPVESNPQNLECLMVSEKKVVATYDADSTTLIVIAEGQGILDEIVVLLLVHLYRRANNIDFIQSQLSTS